MSADRMGDAGQERRRIEAELDAEGPGWREKFCPGSFGCHELLDRLSLISKLLDEAVVMHPACVQEPEWFALAWQASEILNDLYQRVGVKHL